MPRIYISYRRADSAAYAGRLYDHLAERFGSDSVFLDISAVKPGDDFTQVIGDAVRSADIVLVIIGRSWLSPEHTGPVDAVRSEVAAALAAGVSVVPLLIDGARMPPESDLPGDLVGLTRRNALVLEGTTWQTDVARLTSVLERRLEAAPAGPSAERKGLLSRLRQLVRPDSSPASGTAARMPKPDSPHDRSQAVSLVMSRVDFAAAADDLPAVALAVAGVGGDVPESLSQRVEELRQASMSNRAKALSLGFAIETVVGLEALGAAVETLGDSVRGAGTERQPRRVQLFYSYSHRDEELRAELEKHLTILRRRGVIRDWHDRKIAAGSEWRGQIDQHLEQSQLILLLISADFIASDYCYDIELTRAMERHRAGTACVVPVVLRPVYWKGAPFGELQALPTDAKAVTQYENRDEALTIIAEGIAEAAARLKAPA